MPEPLRKKGNVRLTSQERAREKYLEQKSKRRFFGINARQVKELLELKYKDILRRIKFLETALSSGKFNIDRKEHIKELLKNLEVRKQSISRGLMILDPSYQSNKYAKLILSEYTQLNSLQIQSLKRYAKIYKNGNRQVSELEQRMAARKGLKPVDPRQDQMRKEIDRISDIAKTGIDPEDLIDLNDPTALQVQIDKSIWGVYQLYHWAEELKEKKNLDTAILCLEAIKDAVSRFFAIKRNKKRFKFENYCFL